MAQIATVGQPISIDAVDVIGNTTRANRFPVPPTAIGFTTWVEQLELTYDGLQPPYSLVGAVYPESDFLEPTTGQIWPRIG